MLQPKTRRPKKVHHSSVFGRNFNDGSNQAKVVTLKHCSASSKVRPQTAQLSTIGSNSSFFSLVPTLQSMTTETGDDPSMHHTPKILKHQSECKSQLEYLSYVAIPTTNESVPPKQIRTKVLV